MMRVYISSDFRSNHRSCIMSDSSEGKSYIYTCFKIN